MSEIGNNSTNDTTAALLSGIGLFIPIAAGLGQMYNGDYLRGITFSVVQLVNVFLIFLFVGLITYPVVAIWAIFDAAKGSDAPLYNIVGQHL